MKEPFLTGCPGCGDDHCDGADCPGNDPNTSKGHVCFHADLEFFHGPDGTLYKAPVGNPLDLDGYRQGSRFECLPRRDNHKAYMTTLGIREES